MSRKRFLHFCAHQPGSSLRASFETRARTHFLSLTELLKILRSYYMRKSITLITAALAAATLPLSAMAELNTRGPRGARSRCCQPAHRRAGQARSTTSGHDWTSSSDGS